jgi:nucleoside-diphosphate-sugar epimerase
MFFFGSGAIVVTGASGWVGRSLLEKLYTLLPPKEFFTRVRAFSSESGSIYLDGGLLIPTQALSALPELANKETCSLFLHAAFLTPDRCASLGHDAYAAINRSITKLVESAVLSCSSARVVLFSSGAAALAETNQAANSDAKLLYAALKLDEERRMQSIATSLTLRIYALSGRYIREPRRYALGDFIYQAMQSSCIEIKSSNRAVRGYTHADCLAEAGIHWLLSDLAAPDKAINAVTHEIDLIGLASVVANVYGGIPLRIPAQFNSKVDIYSASPIDFTRFLESMCIDVPSIEHQIRDTAFAVRAMLSSVH